MSQDVDPLAGEAQSVRCRATSRSGEQCKNAPMVGQVVCRMHGGSAGRARAAARRRTELAEVRREMVAFGVPVEDADPGRVLLDLIKETAGVVEWLGAQVRDLDPEGLWWGVAQREEGLKEKGPVDVSTYKADVPVVVRMWQEERDRLARFSAAALKAGIEERRVRVVEAQGKQISGIFKRALAAVNLSPEQLEAARAAILVEMRQARELEA